MARKTPGTHSDLIRCSACGEDYSSTYKRCPFCGDKQSQPQSSAPEDDYVFEGGYIFDELDAEKEETMQQTRGGKRLASGNKPAGSSSQEPSIWERLNLSPVRIIGFLCTLLIIISAILIMTKVVLPMINRGSVDVPDSSSNQNLSQSADPNSDTSPSGDPDVDTSPVETDSPEPTESIPADQTATGLTLNYEEFSISDAYPAPVQITAKLSPSGSTATITWSSSDESVATVSQNGLVTGVGKGKCTITASIPGGAEATCLVRCSISGSSSDSSSSSSSSDSSDNESSSGTASDLSLNREDFTLNDNSPSFTLKASGASGTVTWTSSDDSVATVDANGKVTKVSKGKCTVTATDENGNSVSCIVRCN